MRKDAIFIGVEVDDSVAGDSALGTKLEEVCPVNIYKGTDSGVEIVEGNLDECVLCKLCYDAAPDGTIGVFKIYDADAKL
jgi:NAD-dependent dihydropyrimidine dehydrogenase PreA subunit